MDAAKMEVANTILAQLGGGIVGRMLGVAHFVGGENFLQFRFKAKALNGTNTVKVILDPTDTYTVEFWKIRGTTCKKVHSVSDVYAEDLVAVCEEQTGLAFHMGRIARSA